MKRSNFLTVWLLLALMIPANPVHAQRSKGGGNRSSGGSSRSNSGGIPFKFDTAVPSSSRAANGGVRPGAGREGYPPPTSRPDRSRDIKTAIDIGTMILKGIENSRPPRNDFPRRPNPGPVRVPVTVPNRTVLPATPPANIVITRPDPVVPVPRNVLPPAPVAPARNYVMSSLPSASTGLNLTAEQAGAAAGQLDQQANEQIDAFNKDHEAARKELDRFKEWANDPNSMLTPEQRAKVEEALKEGDPRKLEEAAKAAGVPDPIAEVLASYQAEQNAQEALTKAVKDGGTAQEIARKSNELLQAQKTRTDQLVAIGAIPPNDADAVLTQSTAALNNLTATTAGRDALQDLKNGIMPAAGSGNLPTGTVMTFWLPDLTAGQVYLCGSQYLFVGTGEGGRLTCGVMSPAEAGLPVVDGELVPQSDGETARRIVLRNPEFNSAGVAYLLDGQSFTMEAGYSQELAAREWVIAFDRGGTFGEARYTLSAGTYEFSLTENGWDIISKPVKVSLDNTANPYDFHFVVNNQQRTVKARETVELTDPFAVQIRFDPGNGQPQKRSLDSGIYSIAVDPRSQLLDLFTGPAIPERTTDEPPAKDLSTLALAELDFTKLPKPLPTVLVSDKPAPKVMQPPSRALAP